MSLFKQTQHALSVECHQLYARLDEGKSIFALRMYDVSEAKKLANRALSMIEKAGIHTDGAGRYARISLTAITYLAEGYDSYIEFIETLSKVSDSYLLKLDEINPTMFRGIHQCATRQYEAAVHSFKATIDMSNKDAYYLPAVRNMLAVAYIASDNDSAGREQLIRALNHGLEISNYPAVVAATYELDRLDNPQATFERRLQSITNLSDETINIQTIGRIAINIGSAYISFGFYERAREMFKIALHSLKGKTTTAEFLKCSRIIGLMLIYELTQRRKMAKRLDSK